MKAKEFKKVALCIIAASVIIGILMMIAGGIIIACGIGSGWIMAVGLIMALSGVIQYGLIGADAQGD